MKEIRVVDSKTDGAELRRERYKYRYNIQCDGKDDKAINEALASGRDVFCGLGDKWDKVFGDK